jgi:hypothetical protein
MNKLSSIKRSFITFAAVISVGSFAVSGIAQAITPSTSASGNALAKIKSAGATAISARLVTLNKLSTQISSSKLLSASDQTYLSNEVSTQISGLTSLKAKLAADTTVSTATTDAQSITSAYRVYALVVPKVELVSSADHQLTTEGQLLTLTTTLQTDINTAQAAGKNVTAVQKQLNTMKDQVASAQGISSVVETSVLPLQPSDWNANNKVLSGYGAKLNTAQKDNGSSSSEGRLIAATLKTLNK